MANENVLSSINNREIRNKIYTFRGKQVMTDRDLAELYHVSTKRLNEQVNRNKKRFPEKFMFQLSEGEYAFLRSQFATSSERVQHGGRRYPPYVFTEQGITMLSAVLRSDVAVNVSIQLMDAFVEMRRIFISNTYLFERMDMVELKQLDIDKKIEKVLELLKLN